MTLQAQNTYELNNEHKIFALMDLLSQAKNDDKQAARDVLMTFPPKELTYPRRCLKALQERRKTKKNTRRKRKGEVKTTTVQAQIASMRQT